MKWNSSLYDAQHDFVSKYGESLITQLNAQPGESILDLGCGTGDLAAQISESGAEVLGIDSSEEMINTAREKYPRLNFEVAKAENFHYPNRFDAIFSNATLHWVLRKENAIASIYNSLKTGGRLVAELGGKGNVHSIVHALKEALTAIGKPDIAATELWYFPSLAEYSSLLEKAGFRVQFASHFDRDTILKTDGIRIWLQMFARAYLDQLPFNQQQEIIDEVANRLEKTNLINGEWHADYVRLRIIAIKP